MTGILLFGHRAQDMKEIVIPDAAQRRSGI
jgi:hypothetical protein